MATSGSLGGLSVDLLLETVEWIAGLNKAEYQAQKFADAIEKKFDKLGKVAFEKLKGLAAGAIASFSAKAIFDFIDGAAEAADKLATLSQQTGNSVEMLTALQAYAGIAGKSIEQVTGALAKFDVTVAKSADSTSEQAKAFEAFGVNVKGLSADQAFTVIADKFARMEDGANKTAWAVQFFGKAGAEMIPVMNAMGGASDELKAATEEHGKVVARVAEQYGVFSEQQRIAKERSGSLASLLAEQFLPYVTELYKQFNAAAGAGGSLNFVVQGLVNAFKGIVIVVDAVITAIMNVVTVLFALQKAQVAFYSGDFKGAWESIKEGVSSAGAQWGGFTDRVKAAIQPVGEVGAAMDKVAKEKAPPLIKSTKDAADEAKKMEENYQRLLKSITEKTAIDQIETQWQTKLTDGQKLAFKILTDIREGTVKLTDARKADLAKRLEQLIVGDKERALQELLNKGMEFRAKRQEELNKAQTEAEDIYTKLRDANIEFAQNLEFENSLYGKQESEIKQLTAARIIDMEVKKKLEELDKKEVADYGEYQRLKAAIIAEGQIQKVRVSSALAVADANKRATAEIESTWADVYSAVLSTGQSAFATLFDSVGGGWRKMLDGMARDFQKILVDFVYKQFVQPIVLQILAQAPGGLGQFASSQMAGMPGGGMGLIGNLFSGGANAGPFGASNAAAGYPAYMSDPSQFAGSGAGWGIAGYGIAGGLGGYGAARLWGAGQRGQQAAANYGATGAMIGGAIGGPWGALAGWGIGTIAGIASDPKGDAMRSATFGAIGPNTKGATDYQYSGAFGTFGISDTKWFSDSEMGAQLKAFISGMQSFDNAIAATLKPEEIDRVKARLAALSKEYQFGMEHGGIDSLGDILKDRMAAIVEELAPQFKAFFDTFSGSVEDFQTVLSGVLQIRAGTDFDPSKAADAVKQQADLQNSLSLQYQKSSKDVTAAIAAWDGSATSTSKMVDAMGAYQEAAVQMVLAIDAITESMHAMFKTSEEQIATALMTPEEKFKYLQSQTDDLVSQLATETDPAKIEALGKKINDDIMEAWGLLTPDQQARLQKPFLDKLDYVDSVVSARLSKLRTDVTDDSGTIMATIATKLDAIFTRGEATATKNDAAADKHLVAANTPVKVVVYTNDAGAVTSAG